MKRDKIISVRVDSSLLDEVQKIIDSRTTHYKLWGRNHYSYTDESGHRYEKYTIADLLESAMTEYIKKFTAEQK